MFGWLSDTFARTMHTTYKSDGIASLLILLPGDGIEQSPVQSALTSSEQKCTKAVRSGGGSYPEKERFARRRSTGFTRQRPTPPARSDPAPTLPPPMQIQRTPSCAPPEAVSHSDLISLWYAVPGGFT